MVLGSSKNTIAISPFRIVGKPSAKPRIILLFPKTNLRGIPLPVNYKNKREDDLNCISN